MTAAHAEAILTRVRGHMEANGLGGFFNRAEMAAALWLLDEARAERTAAAEAAATLITADVVTAWHEAYEAAHGLLLVDEERTDSGQVREALEAVAPLIAAPALAERDRARHDLAAQGWQPLPADWHAQVEANHGLAVTLAEMIAERDRLVSQILADAKSAGSAAAQDELRAERDRLQQALRDEETRTAHYRDRADELAGQVQAIRDLTVWRNGAGQVDLHDSKTVRVGAVRRALRRVVGSEFDGEAPS